MNVSLEMILRDQKLAISILSFGILQKIPVCYSMQMHLKVVKTPLVHAPNLQHYLTLASLLHEPA